MYSPSDLREIIARALAPGPDTVPAEPDLSGSRPAAVLVPVIADGAEPRLVFTERTRMLSRHAGEISFPGGLPEEGEELAEAALRETMEELGIRPETVSLLGVLPSVHTHVSGMMIVPFVGLLAEEPAFVPNGAEIAEVLVFSLRALSAVAQELPIDRDGVRFTTPAFDVDGHLIWGATARIVRSFLDRLELVESGWNLEPAAYRPGDEELRSILGGARTIAVVGLSSKPWRPSNEVAAYLQEKGYRIIPVNPNEAEVLGERAYPSLLDVPERIDAVDVFRRAEETPPIAEQAVKVGAKVLWLQDGIVNEDARRIAEEGGLEVVMGTCMMREHSRLEG